MKVVVEFDIFKFSEVLSEHPSPVIRLYHYLTFLCSDQLSNISTGRVIDNLCYVIKTANLSASKTLLKEAKTPVRGELGVPNY